MTHSGVTGRVRGGACMYNPRSHPLLPSSSSISCLRIASPAKLPSLLTCRQKPSSISLIQIWGYLYTRPRVTQRLPSNVSFSVFYLGCLVSLCITSSINSDLVLHSNYTEDISPYCVSMLPMYCTCRRLMLLLTQWTHLHIWYWGILKSVAYLTVRTTIPQPMWVCNRT